MRACDRVCGRDRVRACVRACGCVFETKQCKQCKQLSITLYLSRTYTLQNRYRIVKSCYQARAYLLLLSSSPRSPAPHPTTGEAARKYIRKNLEKILTRNPLSITLNPGSIGPIDPRQVGWRHLGREAERRWLTPGAVPGDSPGAVPIFDNPEAVQGAARVEPHGVRAGSGQSHARGPGCVHGRPLRKLAPLAPWTVAAI